MKLAPKRPMLLFLCPGNSCRGQMAEEEIDISSARSKHVCEAQRIPFDHAHATCQIFPGKAKVLYRGFDDPSQLAGDATYIKDALIHSRSVRDEIRSFIVEEIPETRDAMETQFMLGEMP